MGNIVSSDQFSAAFRAQADALEIEALAKRRLADEYDAAQERGEVAVQGKPSKAKGLATASQIGLSYKEIHEARTIRDAEKRDPGVVRRTVDAAIRTVPVRLIFDGIADTAASRQLRK